MHVNNVTVNVCLPTAYYLVSVMSGCDYEKICGTTSYKEQILRKFRLDAKFECD